MTPPSTLESGGSSYTLPVSSATIILESRPRLYTYSVGYMFCILCVSLSPVVSDTLPLSLGVALRYNRFIILDAGLTESVHSAPWIGRLFGHSLAADTWTGIGGLARLGRRSIRHHSPVKVTQVHSGSLPCWPLVTPPCLRYGGSTLLHLRVIHWNTREGTSTLYY